MWRAPATRGPDLLRPRLRWLAGVVALLALAAAGLAGLAQRQAGAPSGGALPAAALLPLLVLACFLGVEFRTRGAGDRLDLFDAALAAALVSLPGPALVVVVVVAKTVALAAQRLPPAKLLFNVAQWACAAAAGGLAFARLNEASAGLPDLVALVAALLVVAAVNAGAVLLVIRATRGRAAEGDGDRGLLSGTAASLLVNLTLGLLFAALWRQDTTSRLVIPVVLVAVQLGTRGWAQRQAGAARLVGLSRAGAALAGPDDLPAATPRFLDELRRAFACDGVELHLRPATGAAWTRTTRGHDGGPDRSAPLVGELLRRGAAVRLAPATGDPGLLALLAGAGWRDCLAAPVGVDGQIVGLLVTHDRTGWEGFESAELGVLEAAAGVLAEAVRRSRLTEVLRHGQAALAASEVRWRVAARILELGTGRAELPETLRLLARTLEEHTGGIGWAVLVRTAGQPVAVAAPNLPAAASAALAGLLPPGDSPYPADGQVRHLDAQDVSLAPLLAAGVRTLRAWPLACSRDSGTAGVLVLCSPDAAHSSAHSALGVVAARVSGLTVDHVLVQHRLAHQAAHDSLTDLPNRGVFLDRLQRALRSTGRGSSSLLVLFLDLDRFKVVNDSLGHAAGDALLRAVAERLRDAVRPGDTVARFGGDEFTMLCEGIEGEGHALRVVQRVQTALARPFLLGDNELFATGSIGIALGRGGGHTAEALVEEADTAMYRAKERGGNCYELFDGGMRDRAVRRLATQSALHRALERGEFRVVYQPTVRLTSGVVEGVEALVRWDRPGHGVVLPGDFVPLAEETGLILPIGAFVLEEACRQSRRWREAEGRPPLSISVNLSAHQLADPGLLDLVAGALERSCVDPDTIALEITESVLMRDVTASSAVLANLKRLGVQLYVDDFGTGYSSLTYLQRFPVDGLKIDRSFVAGLGDRPDATAIVQAVIGLAHGLGLVAVAEGVETPEQVHQLIALDCDIAQGYHFGRPAAAERLPWGSAAAR